MNLLGKIFTFAILFAAIVVLVVAVAVYGTHKNWQTASTALQTQQTAAEAAARDLSTKYQDQISKLEAEQKAAGGEIVAQVSSRDDRNKPQQQHHGLVPGRHADSLRQ